MQSLNSNLEATFSTKRQEKKRLIFGVVLALCIHFLFLHFSKNFFSEKKPTPKIALSSISKEALQSYKKQWERKAILLNTDSKPIDKNAESPKESKFSSDRNRSVKKETRAKVTSENPGAISPPVEERKLKKEIQSLKKLSPFGFRKKREPEQSVSERSSTLKGGNQNIKDPSIAVGSENILNTEENHYYSFYARVFEVTNPLWQSFARSALRSRRFNFGSYVTRAEILLDSDGNFIEVRIHQSSGEPVLDGAIEQTWKKIGRFPNPPKDLIQSDGYVHTAWSFQVNIDERSGLQYLPPERDD